MGTGDGVRAGTSDVGDAGGAVGVGQKPWAELVAHWLDRAGVAASRAWKGRPAGGAHRSEKERGER